MSAALPDFDALWDYSRPAETEAAFRALLPRARLGAPGYLAELLTQIARTHSLRSQFTEAHGLLDEAAELIAEAPPRAEVRYLLERGRCFNSAGRKSEASPLFERAWELGRQAGEHGHAVDAAHMLGICEPPDSALAWNLRAIAYAEECGDPEAGRWLGALYNNTGWTYVDRGDYPAALTLLQKAEAWYRLHGKPTQIRIARYSVAKTLRLLGRVDEALAIQQELRAELLAAVEQDGYVDEELGECLLAQGRAEEARPHFARAHALLSQDEWLVKNEPARLERLRALASKRPPVEG
jgi:tetratricopeptide (TPR) repeat protein